jgi:hypothetical protein
MQTTVTRVALKLTSEGFSASSASLCPRLFASIQN